MLRSLPLTLALAAAAALSPLGAFAGTSETQEGSFVVPYACSVSPVSASMSASGTSASGGGANVYSQNSDTIYSLSPLALAGPLGVNNAAYSGSISLNDPSGNVVVANSSTAGSTSGNVNGLANATGSTSFGFSTSEAAFRAGNYSVASTLSCAQNLD